MLSLYSQSVITVNQSLRTILYANMHRQVKNLINCWTVDTYEAGVEFYRHHSD